MAGEGAGAVVLWGLQPGAQGVRGPEEGRPLLSGPEGPEGLRLFGADPTRPLGPWSPSSPEVGWAPLAELGGGRQFGRLRPLGGPLEEAGGLVLAGLLLWRPPRTLGSPSTLWWCWTPRWSCLY